MNELESFVRIAEIILFFALTILAIYLIISLKRITASIYTIQKNVETLEKNLEPVLKNAQVVTGNMVEITSGIRSQVEKVDSIVSSVKNTADSIIELERKAQRQIETQFFDSLNFISAILKGAKTFFSYFSNSNSKPRKRISSYSSLDSSSEEEL